MTIQPIGTAGAVLYLTPADLSQYGFTPTGLTLDQALTLTRHACRREGICLDGAVEIEVYPECCGVLVFAHARRTGPLWFTFDGLEPLISAALALRQEPVDAALWWWQGRYWLSLPAQAESAAAVCAEFGAQRPADPALAARLDREGRAIFLHHALAALAWHFLRLHFQ